VGKLEIEVLPDCGKWRLLKSTSLVDVRYMYDMVPCKSCLARVLRSRVLYLLSSLGVHFRVPFCFIGFIVLTLTLEL
jgi:hypothetical protein